MKFSLVVGWDSFVKGFEIVKDSLPDPTTPSTVFGQYIFGILEIREIFWRPNYLHDVLRILDIGGEYRATDARDRVYGIAGLCGDLVNLMEKPDYANDSRTYADL